MYYYSKNSSSKVVHSIGCGHLQCANPDNIKTFDYLAQAIDAGYHPCAHCSKVAKKARKEEKFLKEYCKDKHMVVNYNNGWLDIKTPYDMWRVIEASNGFALYHKNKSGTDGNSFQSSYHRQKTENSSFKSVITYIHKHDCYRKYHPFGLNSPKLNPNLMKGSKKYKRQQKQINKYNRKAYAISNAQMLDFLFEQINQSRV